MADLNGIRDFEPCGFIYIVESVDRFKCLNQVTSLPSISQQSEAGVNQLLLIGGTSYVGQHSDQALLNLFQTFNVFFQSWAPSCNRELLFWANKLLVERDLFLMCLTERDSIHRISNSGICTSKVHHLTFGSVEYHCQSFRPLGAIRTWI